MSTDTIKVGLIGAGRIGEIHADNLSTRITNADLVAIADVDEERARALAKHLRVDHCYHNAAELISNQEIHAVVIASSTDTHAALVEQAAAAGKHIFCEKPIDLNLSAVDSALAAVAQAGVRLQVGFNRRFDPSFRTLWEQVRAGAVGQVERIHITSRDPEPPPVSYIERSGGLFLDMTIHDFDMVHHLLGLEPTTVYAAGATHVDPAISAAGDIDTAVTVIEFEGGVIATIDNSRRAVYGYDQRIEVFGSAGMLVAGNELQHSTVRWDANGSLGAKPQWFFLQRYAASFRLEMQAFIDALQTDHEPAVPGFEARAPIILALAARQSLEHGRPVEVAELMRE